MSDHKAEQTHRAGFSSTLRGKILIAYVLIGTLPLCLISIASFTIYYRSYMNSAFEHVVNSVEQTGLSIEILFNDTEKFLEIKDNKSVVSFLATEDETVQDNEAISSLFGLYRGLYKFNNSIEDIHIIGKNGKCISERRGQYRVKHGKSLFLATFRKLLKHPEGIGVVHVSSGDYISEQGGDDTLSVGAVIHHPESNEILGVVILNMNRNIIRNYARTISIGNTGSFYVFTENRDLVFQEKGSSVFARKIQQLDEVFKRERGSYTGKLSEERLIIAYTTAGNTGLKLLGYVPVNTVLKDFYKWINFTAAIFFATVVTAFAAFVFLSKRITRPVEYLVDEIGKAAEGELDRVIDFKGEEELHMISDSINSMLRQLKSIMEQNAVENRNRLKAELALMQQNINPHFLYNTLDTIVWMAEGNKVREVIRMVGALSTFFRTSLNEGQSIVRVDDEFRNIRSYLDIQKMRYKNKLDYSIEASADIMGCTMLKLLLQPLIENSLYHGIKNRRGRGIIRVKGFRNDLGELEFSVEDNGMGINAERLEEISTLINRERIKEGVSKGAFALSNVNRRIKLVYGSNYGITINSDPGEGTVVSIKIPVTESEDV